MTELNLQEGLDDMVKHVKGEPSHVITSKGDGNLIISEMHYDSLQEKIKALAGDKELLRGSLERQRDFILYLLSEKTAENELTMEDLITQGKLVSKALKAIEKKVD